MFSVAKAKRQLQQTATSEGGEMNEDNFSFQWVSKPPTEIEELSLRAPRPVAKTE